MKKIFALMLALVLTFACFTVVTNATEEATTAVEAATEEPECLLNNPDIFDVWTEETAKGCFSGGNQTTWEVTEDGIEFSWIESETADPYITFNVSKYVKNVHGESIKGEDKYYLVLKVKTLNNESGAFELYAKPEAGDSEAVEYEGTGEWEFLFFDMTFTSLSEARKVTSLRMDWSTNAPVAPVTLGAIGFFSSEEAANAYMEGKDPREVTTSDEVETTVAATEAEKATTVAEAATTVADAAPEAATTVVGEEATTAGEAAKGGCGSTVGVISVIAVLGMGLVSFKKKN